MQAAICYDTFAQGDHMNAIDKVNQLAAEARALIASSPVVTKGV